MVTRAPVRDRAWLYRVTISHQRCSPVPHSFRYRSYMWAFDLDRPPRLPGPLGALARYRPEDHIDVKAVLDEEGIQAGRVTVLTNLRVFGYVFNPITVYWCYGSDGHLAAQVAEVHNTYGDRHAYVLADDGTSSPNRTVTKQMYVSPFYPVDGAYTIRISEPGPTVSVAVQLVRPGDRPFSAALTGQRVAASLPNLLHACIRYPAAPLRGWLLIQYQGVRLWTAGLPVQPR
ncbi:MAG: DUF1365 domain-containing protein [Acidimicrobiales bacterium]